MISYRFLHATPENMEWLNNVAAEYGHKPSWHYQILVAELDDEFLAYIELINCPLLSFAINPKVSTPRLTSELVAQVKAWSNISYGNCIVCRPQDPETKFTDQIMEQLGFQNQKLDLFSAKD